MAKKGYVRSLSLILAMLMIFSLFPVQALAYAEEALPEEVETESALAAANSDLEQPLLQMSNDVDNLQETGEPTGDEQVGASSVEGSDPPDTTQDQGDQEGQDGQGDQGGQGGENGQSETPAETPTEPTSENPPENPPEDPPEDPTEDPPVTPTETPTEPPSDGDGEGEDQPEEETHTEPEEPPIDKTQRGIDLQFYKSDVQYNSWYRLSMVSPIVPDTTPFGSLLNREITLDSICRINEQDTLNAFDHAWYADTDKSINGLIKDDILTAIGVWNITGNFAVRLLTLNQDEENIATYVLLLFNETGKDEIRYALLSVNGTTNLEDLNVLFDQYARVDTAVFVENETWSYDSLIALRDVTHDNLELVAAGVYPTEDFTRINVDLAGPQKAVPADGETGDDTGDETGDNTGDEPEGSDPEAGGENPPTENDEAPELTVEEFQEAIAEVEHGATMQEATDEELLNDAQLLPETLMLMRTGMRQAPTLRSVDPPEQVPVTADGITLERLRVRWLSRSTGSSEKAGFGTLELSPENDVLPNQQWQLDFSLSGSGSIDPGTVEIVIPAWIWKDRNGNEPGRLTLAIPEEPDTSNDFAWKRVGDTYVITNTHSIPAASKYMIQGTFRNTWPDPNSDQPFDTTYAHQMVDQQYTGTDQPYTGISDDFYAVMNIVTPRTAEVLSMTSNAIHATLDTYVDVASATMTVVGEKAIFNSVPNALPSQLRPENPSDYFYVQWYVDGRINGCQPFRMDFDFDVGTVSRLNPDTEEYELADVHPIVLGATYTADGTVVATDTSSVQGKLYEGFSSVDKSAYVWVAYPNSEFPGEGVTYRIDSSNTVSATGLDDELVTTEEASGSLSFRTPIIWKIKIEWLDDNDDAKGRRPTSANVWLVNNRVQGRPVVKSAILNDGNDWYMEYVDDGTLSDYEPYEYSEPITRSNMEFIVEGDDGYIEYDNGSRLLWRWWYAREETVYDEATHMWTFKNYYHEKEDWEWLSMLEIRKFSTSHNNNNPKATTDTELQWLRRGEDSGNLIYQIDCASYALPYTLADGGRPSDVSSHFAKYVDLEAVDHDPYFEGRHLEEDEYDIKYIIPVEPIIKNWQPDGSEDETQGTLIDAPFVPMKLYGYVNGEWIQYGEWQESGLVAMNGASLRWGNLFFPGDGVKRVKSTMHFNNAYAEMHYRVCMVLHSTDGIRQSIEDIFNMSDYGMARCFNYGTTTLYDASGNTIMTLTRHDPSYLHGRNYRMAADLDKETEFVVSDMENRVMRFTNRITLTQGTNVLDYMEFRNAYYMGDLNSSFEGTFYDLLPPGMTVDLDSVAIDRGSIKTVNIIDNYQGTGSQLLKVEARLGNNFSFREEETMDAHYGDDTYPASGYANKNTLTFDMLYTFDEAEYRGMEGLRNHSAYEASEEVFGNQTYWTGEPDDPTVGNNKESNSAISNYATDLMTDLDPDRDDPSFVYAGAVVPISELDFIAMTDIRKHVQVSGASRWSYGLENDVNVYEGGKYTYKLQVTSGLDTTTKNIILLDSLDNYQLKEDDPDYNANGQWAWKGSFLSVDVSEIEALGCAPVIYYNTTTGLNFTNANPDNLSTTIPAMLQGNGWTTTLPADPASVKAIAIDCSMGQDGNPFELPETMAVIAYVSMRAPAWFSNPEAFDAVDYQDFLRNAHAYNMAFADYTQVDGFGVPSHAYKHSGYTKTGIIGVNLDVEKVWDDLNDNDRIRPTEATVYLYANEESTGRSLILNEDNNWSGVFEHILKYDEDGNQIYYELRDEVEGYEYSSSMTGNKVTIVNTHEPKTIDIPFTKDWTSDMDDGWQSAIPSSITVRLYCNGEYTGQSKTIRKAPNGSWTGTFEGLLKYDQGIENVYTITEDKVDNFITTIDGYSITNTYYPYGDLIVTKDVLSGTTGALATQFKFSLQLKNADESGLPGKFNYTIYNAEDAVETTGVIGNGDEFYLMDGWRLHVEDIPSGTRYVVTEDSVPGFTQTGMVNAQGKIRSSTPAEVAVTNTYRSIGQVNLEAQKTLEGHALSRYQFQFRVYDQDDNVVRAAANAADGSVTFGTLRFTEADDGREFIYTIRETNTGKAGYTYDDSEYTVRIQVADNGAGKMNTVVTYDQDGALFTNEVRPSLGTLTVSKATENASARSSDQEFTFTVNLMDEAGNALGGEYALSVNGSDAGTISNGGTVAIQGGGSFSVTGLPVNARYDIQEQEEPGWEQVSARASNGTIVADTDISASFTNVYSSTGTAQLTAQKELLGKALIEGYYQFELKDAGGNLLSTATAAADGSIVFQPIDYTLLDEGRNYYYYITEVVPEYDDGVVYDTTAKEVLVHVEDDGEGNMVTTITEDPRGMVFHNAKAGNIVISKEIRGNGGNKDQYFTFTLTLTNSDSTAFTGTIEEPEGAHDWTDAGNGVYTFKLKDSQSITIPVPFGVTYNVTEANEEYHTRVRITQNGSTIQNAASGPAAQGTTDYTNGDYSITFTNSLTMIIPTGISISAVAGVALLVVAAAVAAVIIAKKKAAKTAKV